MNAPPLPVVSLDGLLQAADNALRALFAPAEASRAPGQLPESPPMGEADRRLGAGLMRGNHAGEIAAHALYHAQALMARSAPTRQFLPPAASEQGDRLAVSEQ